MTGQNDQPDESLTSQAHDQAGHCPLTGIILSPVGIKGQNKIQVKTFSPNCRLILNFLCLLALIFHELGLWEKGIYFWPVT